MTNLIQKARKEWCEPPISETVLTHYGTKIIATPKGSSCPPSVVAALLDVLRESMDSGYGPDAEAICVICGGEVRYTGLDTCTFDHATDCKRVKAEVAITRALEGK
jgi:hypothetical protein